MSDTPVKRRSRRRAFLLALIVPLLFVWGIGGFTYVRLRQERLNQDLIKAIYRDDAAAVHRLLPAGADANAVDRGDKPVTIGQLWREFMNRFLGRPTPKERTPIPALLVLLDVRPTEMRDVVIEPPENVSILKDLLDHGADVTVKNALGESPIWLASQSTYFDSVTLLADRGANVNVMGKDGETPLFKAASVGDSQMTRFLLDHGADANRGSLGGWTPLIMACFYGDDETIRCLVQRGANVNARSNIGVTPLMALTGAGKAQGIRGGPRSPDPVTPGLVLFLKQAGAKE